MNKSQTVTWQLNSTDPYNRFGKWILRHFYDNQPRGVFYHIDYSGFRYDRKDVITFTKTT